jgi:hypothetical protein
MPKSPKKLKQRNLAAVLIEGRPIADDASYVGRAASRGVDGCGGRRRRRAVERMFEKSAASLPRRDAS